MSVVVVGTILLAVVIAASLLPASRASTVDPMIALRR
jgi:ABC-type lipoprotein release transport system permease subunit